MPAKKTYSLKRHDEQVTLQGELVYKNIDDIKKALNKHVAELTTINVANVSNIDISFIQLLYALRKQNNNVTVLGSLSENIELILKNCSLHNAFNNITIQQ